MMDFVFQMMDLNGNGQEYKSFVVVGIANGIAIPILNVIYKKIAVALTEWELHRTHNAFNEALALKLFMFQFVNSYASLFFIAFWSRSFHRLQFQLFFVMFVGQLVRFCIQIMGFVFKAMGFVFKMMVCRFKISSSLVSLRLRGGCVRSAARRKRKLPPPRLRST